jgi:hypothetical protein
MANGMVQGALQRASDRHAKVLYSILTYSCYVSTLLYAHPTHTYCVVAFVCFLHRVCICSIRYIWYTRAVAPCSCVVVLFTYCCNTHSLTVTHSGCTLQTVTYEVLVCLACSVVRMLRVYGAQHFAWHLLH